MEMFSHLTDAELDREARTRAATESDLCLELMLRLEGFVSDVQDFTDYESTNPSAEALAEAKDDLIIRFQRKVRG